jgi:formyltetrahydrofolate synthetase
LDPRVYKDWEIAEAAEKTMMTPSQWQEKLGLRDEEVLNYGKVAKLNYAAIMKRLADRPNGKYIEVTAITPTPLGEGKSTTSLGLIQGLGKLGLNAGGCFRQPSGGPTMNVKGTAAGGGNSLLVPMTEFSLGLTGDINDIANAHNLAMVALNARMQHEYNYDDKTLAAKNLRRLDIDAKRVEIGWVMDFSAQCLREIIIGLGGKQDGFTMKSRFDITASSELMAILAIATDLADLRQRIGKMILAYDKKGRPVTAADLEVDGAMAAWMRNTINPTLCSTSEGQPCLIHAGPFANIAIGQSSIIADKLALKMFDYNVTESGFGADIGFEKFVDVKCRLSGLIPDVSVLVATIRALKMHGGGSRVAPGNPLPAEYRENNPQLVEAGLPNLLHHLKVIQRTGIHPIVCLNSFASDTPEEVAVVKKAVEAMGVRFAVSESWLKGGEGALELALMVKEACDEPHDFRPLYEHDLSFVEKVEIVAKEVYGASSVNWLNGAERKITAIDKDPAFKDFNLMMVKTQLSLSHDPNLKGVPQGWRLPVSDVLIYGGARFICPVTGDIRLMPGTASDPAYRKIDIDTQTGKVKGLF